MINKLLGFIAILFSINGIAQEGVEKVDLVTENFNEFAVFGDKLDDYKVYFTGENHKYATFNTKFQFKLMKYLYKEQNVRHFIFEQSPAVGYLINKIIIEDKDSYLNYLSEMFYTPFYELVRDLRAFNDTIPDSAKILMHGIDVERFPTFSVYALDRMVDTLPTNVYGGEVFEQIKALQSSEYQFGSARSFYGEETEGFNFQFGQVSAWESLKSIIEGSRKYRDSLVVYLGEDSTMYFSILEGLEAGREWYVSEKRGDVKSPIVRERFMVKEFGKFYNPKSNEKYYGQFGRCHLHRDQKADRCYDYYMNSVANRINEMEESLENKVLVIPIFYSESKDFDKYVITDLAIPEAYLDDRETYIFDLERKGGETNIIGFYDDLPFVIISNVKDDQFEQLEPYWSESITEIHFSGYYGYHYFNKLDDLNAEITAVGSNSFTNKWVNYSGAIDFFELKGVGSRLLYSYYPEQGNGDRFSMKGFQMGIGAYGTVGNKWFMAALGYDIVYGNMKLIEVTDPATPNLMQSGGLNKVVYKNDVFVFDPNVELRLTLPIISLNFKTGFNLDMSGKYWKLDQKLKSFSKTSFSSAYIQAGVSLNFKNKD